MTVSTHSLLVSIAAHAALILALASIDVGEPPELRVVGGVGSGEEGPLVRIRVAVAVPGESPGEVAFPPPAVLPARPPQDDSPRRADPELSLNRASDDVTAERPALPASPLAPVEEAPPPPDRAPDPESEPIPLAQEASDERERESPAPTPAGSETATEETRPATVIDESGGPGVEAPRIEDPDALRPRYPLRCRRLGHEGIAVIALEIAPDGRVTAATVARSAGCSDLDRAALDAVHRARFRPARTHGQPVAAQVEQEFRFRLDD